MHCQIKQITDGYWKCQGANEKGNTRILYSENYLKERTKLKENIENLFEYDLTDESESYHYLIEDLINKPTERDHKKNIILSKVDKQMIPNEEDINMFLKLYESTFEKELGKMLLSKFYLYDFLDFDR